MNAILRHGLPLLALVATALATAPAVRVAASRGLSLAVVDAGRATPARDALRQVVVESLGAAVSQRCGGDVGVHAKCVDADHAVSDLGAGLYDAVLYLGRDVPETLRRVDGMTFSATPDANHRELALHLIVPNGDVKLQSLLAAAFASALADERFLDCLNGGDKFATAAAGAKVASLESSR